MHFYEITIGQRDAPRLQFIAMATDSSRATEQHMDLRQDEERIDVKPLPRETLERAINQRRGQL